jgi:hypothetical protein
MVSVTDPYGCILDRSRYCFSQVAPRLYSRGCVPDPLNWICFHPRVRWEQLTVSYPLEKAKAKQWTHPSPEGGISSTFQKLSCLE